MRKSPLRRFALPGALALAAALLGCEKTTVTTQSPSGTTTTTTRIGPTASAAAGMARAGDVLADAALTAKVKAALIAEPDVEAVRIDVDSRDGAVTLTGTQTSQGAVERAVGVAKGIDGVKSVESRLRVDASAPAASEPGGATAAVVQGASQAAARAGSALENGVLTARVKAALLADPDVKGLQIDVDSNAGVVTLQGALDKAASVERAQAIARGVEGVRSVENRLTVKPPG
jgi:hyperosmotically inducible protein